ncbi:MAG: sugar-transfer associated ATP-grasp domain-containing protein, partial [Pseudomonadota bacterium]
INGTTITAHPVSEKSFEGMSLPMWSDVRTLAREAHAILPDVGIIGWDIGISEDGPLVIEANTNPHQHLYQLASGRGIYNEDFMPIFESMFERNKTLVGKRLAKQRESRKTMNKRNHEAIFKTA